MFEIVNPCPSSEAEMVKFKERINFLLKELALEKFAYELITADIEKEIVQFNTNWISNIQKILRKHQVKNYYAVLMGIIIDNSSEDIKIIWNNTSKDNTLQSVATELMRTNKNVLHYFTNNNSHISALYTILYYTFIQNKININENIFLEAFKLLNEKKDLVSYFDRLLSELRNETPLDSKTLGYVVIRIDGNQFGVPINNPKQSDFDLYNTLSKNYLEKYDTLISASLIRKKQVTQDILVALSVSGKLNELSSFLNVELNKKSEKYAFIDISSVDEKGYNSTIEFYNKEWDVNYARNYMSSL